eukprot:SAG22_NODE_1107_length_5551_cov_9.040902_1_plen_414_part_00
MERGLKLRVYSTILFFLKNRSAPTSIKLVTSERRPLGRRSVARSAVSAQHPRGMSWGGGWQTGPGSRAEAGRQMASRSTAAQRNRNRGPDSYPLNDWAVDEARASWDHKWDSTDAQRARHLSLRGYLDDAAGNRQHPVEVANRSRDGWADYHHDDKQRWQDKVLPKGSGRSVGEELIFHTQHHTASPPYGAPPPTAATLLGFGGGGGGSSSAAAVAAAAAAAGVGLAGRPGTASEDDLAFLLEQQEGRRLRQYSQLLQVQRELEALDTAIDEVTKQRDLANQLYGEAAGGKSRHEASEHVVLTLPTARQLLRDGLQAKGFTPRAGPEAVLRLYELEVADRLTQLTIKPTYFEGGNGGGGGAEDGGGTGRQRRNVGHRLDPPSLYVHGNSSRPLTVSHRPDGSVVSPPPAHPTI